MSERRCGTHFLNTQSKAALRRALRTARRRIKPSQARQAALAATDALTSTRRWRQARTVALFLSGDGEIHTDELIARAQAAGKRVYLPVIRPPRGRAGRRAAMAGGTLVFRRFTPTTPLRRGLLGIDEPVATPAAGRRAQAICSLAHLDLMVMPLVGFDHAGNRLGMGAGFYDRTLGQRRGFRGPYRVGLAHECQRVEALPHDPWDWRLDACVTDQHIYTW